MYKLFKKVSVERIFIIRSILFVFLFTAPSIGQVLFSQSKFGFNIGQSYSKFQVYNSGQLQFYEFSPNFDHHGFIGNVFYYHSLNRYFSISPSLGYVKRGAIVTRDFGIVGYEKFSLNYIDFSLLVGASPFKFITLNGGLSFNYLKNTIAYWGNDRSANTTQFYKRYDIGLKTGLTIAIENVSLSG